MLGQCYDHSHEIARPPLAARPPPCRAPRDGPPDRDGRAAAEALARVVAADRKRRSSLIALGQALYRLGRLQEAIKHWTRALELDSKDEGLARALEKAKREAAVEGGLSEDLGAPHF